MSDGQPGDRLKERRVALGLRQVDLAGARITTSYVSLLEANKRVPTSEVLEYLAERLGCTAEYLRDGVDPEAAIRARLDLDFAELTLRNGDPAEARAVFARLMDGQGVPATIRWDARWGHARALEGQGDLDAAIEAYGRLEAEAALQPIERPWLSVATALCRCSLEAGDVARATEMAERSLARARERGLDGGDAHAELLSTLVFCYYRRNDLVHASRLAEDLIDLTDATGSRRARGAAYWNAAGVAEARGSLADAVVLAERAVALYAEEDDERSLARVSVAAAWFLMRTVPPQPMKARDLLRRALRRLADVGSVVDRAYAHTEMSRAELLLGHPEKALDCATRAVELLGGEPRSETATAHVAAASALHGLGRGDEAREHLARAEASLRSLPASRFTAMAWRRVGDLHRDLGNDDEALSALDKALEASGLPANQPAPVPSFRS